MEDSHAGSQLRGKAPGAAHHLGLLLIVLLLAACGQAGGTAQAPTAGAASLSAIPAASELTVGQNRLPLGVVKDGTPVNDPNLKVHVRLFFLGSASPNTVLGEADAVYLGQGLPFGLYVAYPTFDRAGDWGVEVQMTEAGGTPQLSRVRVNVLAQSNTPAVGTPAIPVKNLTSKDVPELQRLTSDSEPDPDLYQLTVADALAAKQPFLVTFSTPGFCQTAVCGPNLKVIKQLKETFKGQINFIHVEVYPYPFGESAQQQRRVPAMEEWKLTTEPWTFLVDGQGIIQARYEGGLTFTELEPALKQLAAGQPIQPSVPAS
jgi:hypothetical protein